MADGSPDQPGTHSGTHLEIEAVLDATYYDTPALRLINAGITLRRRTGGADEGWHLKLPSNTTVGATARLEVQRPLGPQASTPPAALLALVQAWLRGADVAPVARLRTTRTLHDLLADDGSRLAELADDAVVAEVFLADEKACEEVGESGADWRELEVELVGAGDEALLAAVTDALLAAGARPAATTSKLARARGDRPAPVPDRAGKKKIEKETGPADAVAAYLAEQYDELLTRDPMVRLDVPEAVHAFWVACRRIRTTLAAFRPVFTGKTVERLRTEVAWIAGLLGGARDAEVMRERLLAEVEEQPAELMVGPLKHRIELELGRRYREAHTAAVRALDSRRYAELLDTLEAFLADPPLAKGAQKPGLLAELVAKSHGRVAEAARLAATAADPIEHDEQLHEVRKAAMRARYAAETVGRHLPDKAGRKHATRYQKAAQAVQEVLGDHHDSVVLQVQLLDLATRAHRAGESTFGYGVMHADLRHRRALDEEEFARAWHDLERAAADWPG